MIRLRVRMFAPSTVITIGISLIDAGQVVARAHADPTPAVNVHGVVDDLAHAFGEVVLDDRGHHRGPLAGVHGVSGHHPRGVHEVGVAADAREGFLYTPSNCPTGVLNWLRTAA